MMYDGKEFNDELEVLQYVWHTNHETILKEIKDSKLIKKCDTRATELKDLANVQFSKHNFDDAQNLYITALMTAEYQSNIYGIALANMSACYMEMEEWTDAIDVINMALNSSYPKTSHPKLYIRKIKAFIKISDKVNAEKTASELQDFIETCETAQDKKCEFLKLSCEALKGLPDDTHIHLNEVEPDMEVNPNLPNVSRKIELCTNEKYGRHLIAKDVIKQGECVLIEKPYISIGLYRCSHCNNIIKESILPCKNCTSTIYCSESCMITDQIIHKWECNLFKNEYLFKTGIETRLAYRIFLKTIEAGDMMDEKDKSGPDAFFDFTKLHKLSLKECIKNGSIFHYAKQCWMIMALLSRDRDFMAWMRNKKKSVVSSILMIGKDLLQFCLISVCNAFSTSVVDHPHMSIYISRSFINHSCIPNTAQMCVGNNTVIKALCTIKAGEQIYIDYTHTLTYITINSKRQEILRSNWNFKCECKLCLSGIEKEGSYICPKCYSRETAIFFNLLICNTCRGETTIPFKKLWIVEALKKSTVTTKIDDEILYGMVTLGNGIEINTKSDYGRQAYCEIVARKLKSGDLTNLQKYLPHIRNIRLGDSTFQNHNHKIYRNLLTYTKSTYFSPSRFTPRLEMSTLNCLIDQLTYLEIFWNLYNPYKAILRGIGEMKAFFTIQKQMLQFQETIDWIE